MSLTALKLSCFNFLGHVTDCKCFFYINICQYQITVFDINFLSPFLVIISPLQHFLNAIFMSQDLCPILSYFCSRNIKIFLCFCRLLVDIFLIFKSYIYVPYVQSYFFLISPTFFSHIHIWETKLSCNFHISLGCANWHGCYYYSLQYNGIGYSTKIGGKVLGWNFWRTTCSLTKRLHLPPPRSITTLQPPPLVCNTVIHTEWKPVSSRAGSSWVGLGWWGCWLP